MGHLWEACHWCARPETHNARRLSVHETRAEFSLRRRPVELYAAINSALIGLMFTSFSANIPNSKIDSVSSSVVIDGVQFDKYKITVTVNNSVLFNSFLLSTIHKSYDFGITYVYVDKATKNEIETSP